MQMHELFYAFSMKMPFSIPRHFYRGFFICIDIDRQRSDDKLNNSRHEGSDYVYRFFVQTNKN